MLQHLIRLKLECKVLSMGHFFCFVPGFSFMSSFRRCTIRPYPCTLLEVLQVLQRRIGALYLCRSQYTADYVGLKAEDANGWWSSKLNLVVVAQLQK